MKKLIVVLLCATLVACESHDKTERIYHAWCRAHKVSEMELTFKDWELLRDEKLLPGQVDDSAAQTAAIMSAAALGAQAGKK